MANMKFELSQKAPQQISSEVLAIYVFQAEGQKAEFVSNEFFAQVDKALNGQLTAVCNSESFQGKSGSVVSLFSFEKIVPTKVAVIGLGKKSEFVLDDLRQTTGKFIKSINKKARAICISLPCGADEETADLLDVIVQSVELANYEFGKYHTQRDEQIKLSSVVLQVNKTENLSFLNKHIVHSQLYSQATILARDLVNEQPTVATPTYLANLAQNIAKSNPEITCKIFNRAQAEKLGMGGFLGIARAATIEPKFIFLEFKPKGNKSKRKLALIGKGITFDSGGINVKPGDHMQDMKMDMAGAASVLGVFSVIAKIKPDFTVIGCIAATPNLVSATSIVPGDVVKAYNGKTIEILNTDAEGRVTMADSLSYAVAQGATEIIDFATLTGAALVALGSDVAAMFANNQDLASKVKSAAFSAGEKVWELPLERDYKKLNKSDVADIANIPSSRYGGTITAALFLQEFVGNTPWIHFDIAGPAFAEKPSGLHPKGGTGFGVRTVLKLLENKGDLTDPGQVRMSIQNI